MMILADVALPVAGQTQPQIFDIHVDNGLVSRIARTGVERPDNAQLIDCSGKLAVPGFINAHTHSHAVAMRGLADRWCLEMSLAYAPWATQAQDDELVYWSAFVGAAEMAMSGITSCYDLVLLKPPLTRRRFELVAKAYADVGIRAVLAPMISDISFYDAVPGLKQSMPASALALANKYSPPPAEETLAACRDLFENWNFAPDRIKPAIAPTILNHCSPGFLADCLKLAQAHDLQLHMHVAESELQMHAGYQLYGHSLITELEKRGVLGERFCAAHCVWINDEDRARLAESGAAMAHIPVSNLRLGAGVASSLAARDAGMRVGLATDGANSSDALSLFEIMKQASLLSRVGAYGNPDAWLSARDVFAMATQGGAQIVQFKGVTGRIEEGAAADITLLDRSGFAFTPLNNAVVQLVTAASPRDVSDVLVAGGFVVRDRQLVRADLSSALRNLAACASASFDPSSSAKADAETLLPYVFERYAAMRADGGKR
jgi:5-methylthioadenosine/S-adenosylhomocysteine deaminase